MKINKKSFLFAILSILSLSMLAGCSNPSSSSQGGGSDSVVDPDPEDPVDPDPQDPVEEVYKLTYDLSGGTLNIANPTSCTKETETFTLNNPHKNGYYFQGWSSTRLNGIQQTVIIEKGTTGDFHFTANYIYTGDIEYFNGKTISLLPDPVAELLACDDEEEVAGYLYRYNQAYQMADTAKPLTVTFANVNGATDADLYLYNDEDCTDLAFAAHYNNPDGKTNGKISIYNIFPNQKYYLKVIDDKGAVLKEDSFVIKDTMRTINCGNVVNVRDMGGKEAIDGVTPHRRIYRAADISTGAANSKAIKVLTEQLGIKTEIDLRVDKDETSENPSTSPDSSITMVHCGM